jgi:hypothetical protein
MTPGLSEVAAMAETESRVCRPAGHIKDARGRKVTQLDPIAMHLLRQNDVIPSDALREIAEELDPAELRRRPLAVLWAPIWVVLWYSAWFLYYRLFSTWRGWNPVLIAFGVSYFLCPFVWVYAGFCKARRMRWERVRRVMLEHRRCPHCGYDIRLLPVDAADGATVCPECGCGWRLEGSQAARGGDDG